jgi:hypothetical protein
MALYNRETLKLVLKQQDEALPSTLLLEKGSGTVARINQRSSNPMLHRRSCYPRRFQALVRTLVLLSLLFQPQNVQCLSPQSVSLGTLSVAPIALTEPTRY